MAERDQSHVVAVLQSLNFQQLIYLLSVYLKYSQVHSIVKIHRTFFHPVHICKSMFTVFVGCGTSRAEGRTSCHGN